MVEGEWLEVVPEADDASTDVVGGER
jgi:hypothetical protein